MNGLLAVEFDRRGRPAEESAVGGEASRVVIPARDCGELVAFRLASHTLWESQSARHALAARRYVLRAVLTPTPHPQLRAPRRAAIGTVRAEADRRRVRLSAAGSHHIAEARHQLGHESVREVAQPQLAVVAAAP